MDKKLKNQILALPVAQGAQDVQQLSEEIFLLIFNQKEGCFK
jgi:hypothetical protein